MKRATDLFEFLGLPPVFELTSIELDRRQRELHVECQGQAPQSLELINEAVRQLKDPATRAEQLFVRRGWSLEPARDPALLERVFSDREFVERSRQRRDAEALSAWTAAATLRRRNLIDELGRWLVGDAIPLDQADETADTRGPARRAGLLLEELRYVSRAIEAAQAALDLLEDPATQDGTTQDGTTQE